MEQKEQDIVPCETEDIRSTATETKIDSPRFFPVEDQTGFLIALPHGKEVKLGTGTQSNEAFTGSGRLVENEWD